ncbi:MAG: 3'-5' exonuclease, partial [Terracidiphilus sp.]
QGRTAFVVGDPMQSIYFFRQADAELFPRVRHRGLALPAAGPDPTPPLRFDFAGLRANFRTAHELVRRLNRDFEQVFAIEDGSGVTFSPAEPAREQPGSPAALALHLEFVPSAPRGRSADGAADRQAAKEEREAARDRQIAEIVSLVRTHLPAIERTRELRERGEEAKYRVAVLGRAKTHLAPIALALREAGIPFRAVELEQLADRPEILDALALAGALLNPLDRMAWLGVLRAPWCALSLADLHAVAGQPDEERPIPDLLAERLAALSPEGQAGARRVLAAFESAASLRASRPVQALGTWLQQVWRRLGGEACVDATARANLDLLWACLDRLPEGELDLLGPGLQSALKGLTAQPDPAVSEDCGVQLLSIHKSKGLEFEVVIVPELQARVGRTELKMLSWLERGLDPGPESEPEADEITEFLIAPFQPRGAEGGLAKKWVDGEIRRREKQETRRLLYVAATRAREELHYFARPEWKMDKEGPSLAAPSNCLLQTAWPALEAEVRQGFDAWAAARATAEEPAEGLALAAGAAENLIEMPAPDRAPDLAPDRPTLLRRLPPDWRPEEAAALSGSSSGRIAGEGAAKPATGRSPLYARHEGGLLSRALG